jgi:tellurite resistance protein TerC
MEISTMELTRDMAFLAPVLALFSLDLYLHRKNPEQTLKHAVMWTVLWVSLALAFNVYVYFSMGPTSALNFLTGYIVEQALSVDNLFVIMLIFTFFKIEKAAQHRVLFWGILGAFVMRGIFILLGASLMSTFHSTTYIFGAFLVFTGLKTLFQKKEQEDISKNKWVQKLKQLLPYTEEFHGTQFLVKKAGKWLATPLFLALVIVEFSDLVFAVDSIPAVLAITTDPFIVATSNFFAIIGLRSMYFVLNHFLKYFHYLHYGLGVILTFIGLKMVLVTYIKIPVFISLLVIFFTLFVTVLLSLAFPKKESEKDLLIQ